MQQHPGSRIPWLPRLALWDDPFRRAENVRATPVDAAAWRLASRAILATTLAMALVKRGLPALTPLALAHSALCYGFSQLAARQPAFYWRHREPLTALGHLHLVWTQVHIALGGSMRLPNPLSWPALLGYLCLAPSSLLAYTLQAHLAFPWSCLLSLAEAALACAYTRPICQGLLVVPGASPSLQRLYRVLATVHIAASTPSTAEWLLDVRSPAQQCAAVQRYTVLMLVVALPLLLLWQLERRARARYELQQAAEAHRALEAAAGSRQAAEQDVSRSAALLAATGAVLKAETERHGLATAIELYLASTGVWAAAVGWASFSSPA